MLRVVIDTNVLVAAIRSRRGSSFAVLSQVGRGAFEIAVSVSLVLEYESMLLRHSSESTMSDREIRDIVDFVCESAIWQEIFFLWRPYLRDANDDLVLELAFAAGCDAIVTHNVRDFSGAEQLGVRVITPANVLREIGGTQWEH
ncbi:MAG TPA: putative toxin-antitoxin system toxin component, PIN family [Thermoanaerobaculia bacterium]|nr:putative toxin-antitoxin system toxin component, PIN family [Thermoanaerobaculia bacterium]